MRYFIIVGIMTVLLGTPCLAQETVFGPKSYNRTSDRPDLFVEVFSAVPGEVRIQLTSGGDLTQTRASSAHVSLNGLEIFGPNDFNQAVGELEASVSLLAENRLELLLKGSPGSQITVEIVRAFTEEVPAWRMPELSLVDMAVSPLLANPFDEIEIAVTVGNTARGETPESSLSVTVDGEEICNQIVPPLASDKELQYTCFWTAEGSGKHAVRAELEIPEDGFDGSLSNDVANGWIRVSGEPDPLPEIELAYSGLESFALNVGESYALPLQVRNAGYGEAHRIGLAVYIDSEPACILPEEYEPSAGGDDILPPPIDCIESIENLGAGEEEELQFLWPEATPGEHIITTQVLDLDDPDAPVLAIRGFQVVVPAINVLHPNPETGQWTSLGPKILDNSWTGRITSVAFDRDNPSTAYASGAGNDNDIHSGVGVWKTKDGGSQWFPVGDGLPSLVIGMVAVDPAHTSIVYASGFQGIFKSLDGGATWFHFAGPTIVKDAKLWVGSTGSGDVLIYAATANGLKRYTSSYPLKQTSDFADWDLIRNSKIRDLAVHPSDSSKVYISDGNSIYRTDDGATMSPVIASHYWTKITSGLPSGLSSVTLDIHEKFPERVYAGISNPGSGFIFSIYRSDNEGSNWSKVIDYAPGDLDESLYNPFIRVVPLPEKDIEIIYFGGVRLYQFVNYPIDILKQKTFRVKAGWSADMKTLEFVPGLESSFYWLADDQGIFQCKIEANPEEWQLPDKKYGYSGDICIHRNLDLRVTELYDIDLSTTTPNRIVGGTQDTGTILYDGDPVWKTIKGGDGLYSFFNPHDDTIVYGQNQALNDEHGTARSDDGGKSWRHIAGGLPKAYGLDRAFITPVPDYADAIVALGDGRAMYFHQSPDLFPWVPWASILPVDVPNDGLLTRILIHSVDSSPWWLAGTNKGKIIVPWTSSTGFKTAFAPPNAPPVKTLAASPIDSQIIYVLLASAIKQEIWRVYLDPDPDFSIATEITYNFPSNLKPMSICADPSQLDVVYVGTDKGVMRLLPGTTIPGFPLIYSWKPYNDGLPLTSIVDLVASSTDNALIAATKGRGVWKVITAP